MEYRYSASSLYYKVRENKYITLEKIGCLTPALQLMSWFTLYTLWSQG